MSGREGIRRGSFTGKEQAVVDGLCKIRPRFAAAGVTVIDNSSFCVRWYFAVRRRDIEALKVIR